MPIHVQCRKCGRDYDIKEKFAGRVLPCKECGAKFKVPEEAVDEFVDYDDEFDDMFGSESASPARRRRSSGSSSRSSASSGASSRRKRSRSADEAPPPPPRSGSRRPKSSKKSRRSKSAPPPDDFFDGDKFRYTAVGVIAVMIILSGIWWAITVANMKNGGGNANLAAGNSGDLFPVASISIPNFPAVPPNGQTLPSGVRFYDVRLNDTNTPGGAMQFRVYMPPGKHAPASLGCVLVAPAGSNLLSGNSLDGSDYHDETEPYAKAGFAVVSYSIDGALGDLEFAEDEDLAYAEAYTEFRDAHAGVVNGRNALEFALAQLPQVNPQAIFSAGHSSAGTLSVLLAEHEPRLAGCVAYAPATDVVARLGEVALDPYTTSLLPGVTDFIVRSSPRTHAGSLNCPVFLFHARDDSNEPFKTTEQFANETRSLGKDVTLKLVPSGDHYDSMINQGIPAGIAWLKQHLPANASGTNQTASAPQPNQQPQPQPQAQAATNSERPQTTTQVEPTPSQPSNSSPETKSAETTSADTSTSTNQKLPERDIGPPIPPGTPVVIFEVTGYQGRGVPHLAVQRTFIRERWVRRPFIRWEGSQSRIVVAVQGGNVDTGSGKAALEAAGFEIGSTQYLPGGLP